MELGDNIRSGGGAFAFAFESDSEGSGKSESSSWSAAPKEKEAAETKPERRQRPSRKETFDLPPAPVDNDIDTLLELAVSFNADNCDPTWESSETRRERLALAKQIHQVAKTDKSRVTRGQVHPGVLGLFGRRGAADENDDVDFDGNA